MRKTIWRLNRPKSVVAEAGYTLTEMLVVIGIICVIAAVLTPSLLGQMGRARYKAAQLQLDTVSAALEAYRSDTGSYPSSTDGLNALVAEPTGSTGWSGPYIRDKKTLNDPWNRPIRYISNDGRSFYVESYGADGKAGGGGVDRDLRSPAS